MDAPGSGSGLVSRRIFVGSVSFSSTNESIAAFFGQFGPVETAEIICDPHTGRSRGFAFVTFGDDGSCARALLDRAPTVDGRTVDHAPWQSPGRASLDGWQR